MKSQKNDHQVGNNNHKDNDMDAAHCDRAFCATRACLCVRVCVCEKGTNDERKGKRKKW